MVVSTQELIEFASESGFRKITKKFITNWVVMGLLDSPTRVFSNENNISTTTEVWPDSQRELFLQLLIYRPSVDNVAALASLPVASWLYWDHEHVPLRQAKKALKTFWKPDRQLLQPYRTVKEAWTIVQSVLGEAVPLTSSAPLHGQIVRILNHQALNSESIGVLVDDLLSQLSHQGVETLKANVTEVADVIRSFALAMANYDRFTDDDFTEARARQRHEVLRYLWSRPEISDDPTPQDWINQVDYTFLLHNACQDLIVTLGRSLVSTERGETLAQAEPADWRGLSVEFLRDDA